MDKIILHRYNTYFLKTARIGTATSLTLSFANTDYWLVDISANASYTLTNIPVGKLVYIEITNSHATNLITITNPTASTFILQRGLTTVSLLAGERVIVELFNDGTNTRMIYGEALLKNA